MGFVFDILPFVFLAMFLLVFGFIIFVFVIIISQWNRNNRAPRLTVDARVVGKRTNVSRHRAANDMYHTSTTYYVTFQVESGDRLELQMSGMKYGLLVEGDTGRLTFQGTRFLDFSRP